MRARLLSSVLIAAAGPAFAACGFSITGGAAPSDDEPLRDAALDQADAPIDMITPDDDATMPCDSFSPLLATCPAETAADIVIPEGQIFVFDTLLGTLSSTTDDIQVTTAVVVLAGSPIESRVLYVNSLTVAGTLRAVGTRPFVIVANDSVTIADEGLLDVSVGGAGARGTCPSMAMPGMPDPGGGAGGGGGGYGGNGTAGGNGNNDGPVSTGGAPGLAEAVPATLLGGCPGGNGGDGNAMTGGRGGPGGGAIAIIARTAITLDDEGTINAGGGGGAAGSMANGGGGGGGSGGMIIVDAPAITSGGRITANGGGGGEGGDLDQSGENGENGRLSSGRARGGDSNANAGSNGGDGGAGSSPNGTNPSAPQAGGGGGGGGGVGFIIARGDVNIGGTVSPPLVTQ